MKKKRDPKASCPSLSAALDTLVPILPELCERVVENAVLKDPTLEDVHSLESLVELIRAQKGSHHVTDKGMTISFEFIPTESNVLRIAERIIRQK